MKGTKGIKNLNMKRKSSTSGSQKRKSSAPSRRMVNRDSEEFGGQLIDNLDEILAGFDLPALFERAVSNVNSRVASLSNEEYDEAVQSAQKRLKLQFNIDAEKSFTTDSSAKKVSGKKKKDLKNNTSSPRKSSLGKKKSSKNESVTERPAKRLKSSNFVENEIKKESTVPLLAKKSRRLICIPVRYVPETKSLSSRLERRRREMKNLKNVKKYQKQLKKQLKKKQLEIKRLKNVKRSQKQMKKQLKNSESRKTVTL